MFDPNENYDSKLYSNFTSEIVWESRIAEYILLPTEVHVWNIDVPSHFQNLFKKYRSYLNVEELKKANQFYWEKDFQGYLTSKIALRILLSRYLSRSISDITFGTQGKKPMVQCDPSIKFNLSHSNNSILLSISLCETGIDIESIRSDFDIDSILPSCFSAEEVEFIRTDDRDSHHKFFLHWTRKEALLKYTGQGIVDDLTLVPTLNGTHDINSKVISTKTDVNLLSFDLKYNRVGSLVYPSYIDSVRYFELI